MIATYNVVKILDAFNMVELEDGGYVQKGINGENVNAALNSLKPYDGKIENGELDTIIKAFLAKDVKIIATIKKTNFNGESIKEWDDFCIKVKRGEFETDEPKEVEPPKDTSKDQTKKAATESEYTVKIGEKDYTMDKIVELLKDPDTPFSVIFSICNKYKNGEDGDFNKACENTDYRNIYKVSNIIDAYYSCMFETKHDSGAFLDSLNVLSNGYDSENKEKSLWEYEQMLAIQAISYSIKLGEDYITYSKEGIVTRDDMLDFISNEMGDKACKWEKKSLSSLKTKAVDFVRNQVGK